MGHRLGPFPSGPTPSSLSAIPRVANPQHAKRRLSCARTRRFTDRQSCNSPNVLSASSFPRDFLLPEVHTVRRCSLPFFSRCSQAPRPTERLRPAARRSSASLWLLNRSWFLPLRGHPPRKQTLALGSSLTLAPSGWCALRVQGIKRRRSCLYMLSGIASGSGLPASGSAIKARRASPRPLPERRPATPKAARLGRSGGSGQQRGTNELDLS